MEFISPKLNKSLKRKRLNKNRRRNQRKFEVKLAKRKRIHDNATVLLTNNIHTMTADTFWENYKVAQDWQYRHTVAWWKSRCTALQRENEILRNKIREQACQLNCYEPTNCPETTYHTTNNDDGDDNDDEEQEPENIEFQVDADMMKFLEQSIRHKMELKQMRERENQEKIDDQINEIKIESGEARDRDRVENAKLLYGSASSRIITMETALQVSVDHYKDHSNPHYWPNIPLKP